MSSPSDEESFRTACQSGALPAVAAFLANPLFDANARNPRFGSTGFILACVYGQAAVVELLLGAPGGRVDVNARDNEGWSGVYGAVAVG